MPSAVVKKPQRKKKVDVKRADKFCYGLTNVAKLYQL